MITRIVLALLALYIGAFLEFTSHLKSADPNNRPQADGIVALTGGTERLDAAMHLLAKECCRRLLITGVHADTTRDDLRRRFAADEEVFDCCVDLDHAALDTAGNAQEISRWASDQGFDSLIVVTASYHMPRSLLLISEITPHLHLIPYAVSPEFLHLDVWWRRPATMQLLVGEFTKYLISLSRRRLGLAPDGPRAAIQAAVPFSQRSAWNVA
jgi:uncharacterized SAM-binding protein YcdF (DUF218 family)